MVPAQIVDLNVRLEKSLLSSGKVQEDDINRAKVLQTSTGLQLAGALIRIGAISEDNMLQELSFQLGVKVLERKDLPGLQTIYKFMSSCDLNFDWFISKEVAIWPDSEQGFINCLCRKIHDVSVSEVVRKFFVGKEIVWFLGSTQMLDGLFEELEKEHSRENLFSGEKNRHLRELAEEAPVVDFVNNIIAQAVDANASDIHIEPEETEFKVRFRVDGVLHDRLNQPIERFAAVASRIKLVSGLDIAERRVPQDGRMTTRLGGSEMDVRVSSTPCVFGESVVMRLLPKDENSVELTNLGMEPDHYSEMRSWARLTSGIVLVTGPTGSGKSTTLHAALSESNDGTRKIITVEDPVEKRVRGVTQIQVHEEIGYTFAHALRAILRQDPDVIMIGEIRDAETAEIAIQAALSGHLVFSTLHTNDALSAFTRLIDMGVEPFLVASPLRGVQAQRLVRKLCSVCSEDTVFQESSLPDLDEALMGRLGSNWKRAVGCSHCQNTGFSGRVGIYEMINVGPDLQELVIKEGTINELRNLAFKPGVRTLLHDGFLKASQGVTTIDEVFRVVSAESES